MVIPQNNRSWVLMISIMMGIEESVKIQNRKIVISDSDFKSKSVYHLVLS